MVDNERVFQFGNYINQLKAALKANDKERLQNAFDSFKPTHEDFMEMPIELVAEYKSIQMKVFETLIG